MSITGVILNWKRPDNVRRILASWRASGLVSQAIVWSNRGTVKDGWATIIQANRDCGLYSRFAAALFANNPCVLWQDDDLLLPQQTLSRLNIEWLTRTELVHGIFGRRPSPDGSYNGTNAHGDVSVLCRVYMAHRRHAQHFFRYADQWATQQLDGAPEGLPHDDILFCYGAMHTNHGARNRAWKLPVEELPAPHAIHARNGWAAHVAYRTRLMRTYEAWIKPLVGAPEGQRHVWHEHRCVSCGKAMCDQAYHNEACPGWQAQGASDG